MGSKSHPPSLELLSQMSSDRAASLGDQASLHEADPKIEAADAALERRQVVEKSLKRKLDLRCSIFVIIYIMSEYTGAHASMHELMNRLPRPQQHRCGSPEGIASRPEAVRHAIRHLPFDPLRRLHLDADPQ